MIETISIKSRMKSRAKNLRIDVDDYIEHQMSHCNCILSGRQNPISLGLAFDISTDGGVFTQYEANALLQGYEGILHGGIIAALLDAAMTHCLFHHNIEAVTGALEECWTALLKIE